MDILPTTIAILAGGQSRRMGQDKAQLLVGGVTLLEHAARLATEAADTVLIVGRPRPPDWPIDQVRFLGDEQPGLGPIGGLSAALRHGDRVLAIACDMPGLTPRTLHWLWDAAARQSQEHGLAVLHEQQIEPLFSVYTAACLPLIGRQIAEGRRSLHALIAAGDFGHIAAPPEIAAALTNINTPEEFAALRLGQTEARS